MRSSRYSAIFKAEESYSVLVWDNQAVHPSEVAVCVERELFNYAGGHNGMAIYLFGD